jgi:2-polyprenyl-3-methyl-5-hydroxy-6-metoxy-1,4-benzoquinol methylase
MTNTAAHMRNPNNLMNISEFFDEQYEREPRYWWRDKVRYSPDPDAYPTSLLTRETLRLIAERPPGRMLDLGAGEGSDSIRLALLGYSVDAVDISKVGADKIMTFAKEAGAAVNVRVADITTYEPDGQFDIIICNGVLHYIDDKRSVVERMQLATRAGGLNVISLWSTRTPVPECHRLVPVFCDDEDGVVVTSYAKWIEEVLRFEPGKPETSHSGMPPHLHSHIKLIARKP